jgi:ribonuclease HII
MLKTNYSNDAVAEVGCDEAGRGCLAGPVVAAAVMLPADYSNSQIRDSKKMSIKNRLTLRAEIVENAIAYGIGIVSHEEIDEINILNASILAMHRALENISVDMDFILVDGNKFKPYKNIQYACIVRGDDTYQSIAAASILAKTTRDEMMTQQHCEYPEYNFTKNKGYGSREHVAAIEKYGYTPIHRKTFKVKKLVKHLYLFD